MTGFWELQTAVNLFFQSLGGWLETPMRLFTFLGEEQFFMLVMPVFYWCIDSALGLRLGVILLASSSLNSILKMALHTPRPYWINPQVKALVIEPSFGMPSGHSQNSAALWGRMAAAARQRWLQGIVLAVVGLVGLSRLYLGVHSPADVLTGWLLGLVLLWIFLKLEKPAGAWLAGKSAAFKACGAFLVSTAIIALNALVISSLQNWQVPQAWLANAALAGAPAGSNPFSIAGAFSGAGTLFGLLAGVFWMERQGGFAASGSGWRLIARYLLGLAGTLLIWYGLDRVFPAGEALLALVLRWLRYALVGAWISAAAPMLFIRLGLAGGQEKVTVQRQPAA